MFLDSIPDEISNYIIEVHKEQRLKDIREMEIGSAINADDKIVKLNKQLEQLELEIEELSYTLSDTYTEMYDKANPTEIIEFNLHDVADHNIDHITEHWILS